VEGLGLDETKSKKLSRKGEGEREGTETKQRRIVSSKVVRK